MEIVCVICSSVAFPLKAKNSYQIAHCPFCGLEFCAPMPNQKNLADFYDQYRDVRANTEVVRKNSESNLQQLKKHLGQDSRILDFGSGSENLFIAECRNSGFHQSYGYDKFFETADYSISLENLQKSSFNCISLWGVLEHVTDPIETMIFLESCLAADGIIALTTVSTESSIPYQHKPPEHTLYFSRKSLELLAARAGLEIIEYRMYEMLQNPDVYLSILLRTVPEKYVQLIDHRLPEFVHIPTNEVFVVLRRKQST